MAVFHSSSSSFFSSSCSSCYVKSDYSAVVLSKQDSENYDTVYIEVATSKHNKLTIATVYRPPKQQAADDSALYAEIQTMTQNKQSVIIGDFNCPNIAWTTLSGDQELTDYPKC